MQQSDSLADGHRSDISMTNLVLRNSPFWTSHFIYSTDIFVKDVEIYAPFTQGNTDGVNPDSSSNVHSEKLPSFCVPATLPHVGAQLPTRVVRASSSRVLQLGQWDCRVFEP